MRAVQGRSMRELEDVGDDFGGFGNFGRQFALEVRHVAFENKHVENVGFGEFGMPNISGMDGDEMTVAPAEQA